MIKRTYLKIPFLILLYVISQFKISSQIPKSGIRLMFYNVENFFDIYNDSLTDDDAFLPEGVMRWNYKRYTNKLNAIYKTIVAAGEWEPPSIIGLCEIEKRKVLEDLIYTTYLSKFNYSIIHEESPDRRGIDVCLIYRKDKVRVINYKYWIPANREYINFTSRSVLYTELLIGTDTIHLIVNHWPSRRGGVLDGESNRLQIASMIREKVDSIVANRMDVKIIVMGDFNCTPQDEIIKSFVKSSDSDETLINLSDSLENTTAGTYRYMGTWEMIDQVIVTKSLLQCKNGLYTSQNLLTVFKPDFLMHKDPKYPGSSPFSTYKGYKYQGGYSDHLPILLDFKVR
jgi:predicted extracellular nuclease